MISPSYLEDFYTLITQFQPDLIKNTHIIKFHSHIPSYKPHSSTISKIQEFIPTPQNIKIGGTICSYCIKADFLLKYNLSFLAHRIFEDETFIFMALPLSSKTILFSGSPYYYRQHGNSLVTKTSNCTDRIRNFEDIILWYRQHQVLDYFPIPFYMLYDISTKSKDYNHFLNLSKQMLDHLNLDPKLLKQDPLIDFLSKHCVEDFKIKHQKSRGLLKYYLRAIFGFKR